VALFFNTTHEFPRSLLYPGPARKMRRVAVVPFPTARCLPLCCVAPARAESPGGSLSSYLITGKMAEISPRGFVKRRKKIETEIDKKEESKKDIFHGQNLANYCPMLIHIATFIPTPNTGGGNKGGPGMPNTWSITQRTRHGAHQNKK
jgi:hypothetical protein